MQLTHIRKSDLNLLPALAALLDERSISKAAARHHLSQPAMSRVLQRLRHTFQDELLVRTATGYDLTPRARRLQDELAVILPRLDRLLRGEAFDPETATNLFRLCCPDSGALNLASNLPRAMARQAPSTQLELVAWGDSAFEDAIRGNIDVIIWANKVPPPLKSQVLLEDEIVCVMCAGHPLANGHMTREHYFQYPHVLLTLTGAGRDPFDDMLATMAKKRTIGLRVAYVGAAVMAVQGTSLIATMPRRGAEFYAGRANVAIVRAPFDFAPLRYVMAWHPRMDAEPAHVWFRSLIAATAVSK
jgi:DNA-binding transcriptional LysR family regulator